MALLLGAPGSAGAQYAFVTVDVPGSTRTAVNGDSTNALAGEFDDAEKEAREAIELAAELPNERAQATWALAEALAGRGDAQAADVYGQATDLLEAHGTLRERAEALRAYGRYLRSSGREADALDVLERAADVAAELQREPLRSSR